MPEWHVGKGYRTVKAYVSYRAQQERLVVDAAILVGNGHGRVARDVVSFSPSTVGAAAPALVARE